MLYSLIAYGRAGAIARRVDGRRRLANFDSSLCHDHEPLQLCLLHFLARFQHDAIYPDGTRRMPYLSRGAAMGFRPSRGDAEGTTRLPLPPSPPTRVLLTIFLTAPRSFIIGKRIHKISSAIYFDAAPSNGHASARFISKGALLLIEGNTKFQAPSSAADDTRTVLKISYARLAGFRHFH